MESSTCSSDPSAREVATSERRRRQGRYWMGTIPQHGFTPYLPPGVAYIRGQLELGGDGNYLHWQILIVFSKKVSLSVLRAMFGTWHFELTRTGAAADYVWKEATRVDGTRFELGKQPFNRSSSNDWDEVWNNAVQGRMLDIPPDIRIRCYSSLRRIGEDYMVPLANVRSCYVFWGDTGTGKSRRAWDEAGLEAYSKDPRTKFWCGYRGQEHVVLDEFRGSIDVAHLLRWLDRYPCSVETKGGARPLCANKIWITSNLDPREWYPDLDERTRDALLRRMVVTRFTSFF